MENIGNDILNIDEVILSDESIEKFDYREYQSQSPSNLNTVGEIDIVIQNQDIFALPSKSYLLIEGRLVSTGNEYAADAKVALINNAIPYMFSQIRYHINDRAIEDINSPGQATTIKGLLTYGNDFAKGLNMCWLKDTSAAAAETNKGFESRQRLIIAKPDPRGTFAFYIPLAHLFGFCDDYTKVVYGVKHSLLLSRKSDNDAIFRDNGAPVGRITLSKLSWCMPHVTPSLQYKSILVKQIERKIKIPVAFRSSRCESLAVPQVTEFAWRLCSNVDTAKPRWIIVAFQTKRNESQVKNPALFDNVAVSNIYAELNTERYPYTDMALNFTQFKTCRAYEALCNFKEEYVGTTSHVSSIQITPEDFVELYPLFVIDVRHQPERLKTTTLDIHIRASFANNVPADTTAYALIISDKLIYLQSDGSKFSSVY